MNCNMETTITTYVDFISSYGILAMLLTLRELELSNQFDECNKVLIAINICSGKHKISYLTRLTPKVKLDLIENADRFGFKLPNVLANSENNARIILRILENTYKIDIC